MATKNKGVFANFGGSLIPPIVLGFVIAGMGVVCLIVPQNSPHNHGTPLWLLAILLFLFAVWLWLSVAVTASRRGQDKT